MPALVKPTQTDKQTTRQSGVFAMLLLPIGVICICHCLVDTYSATLQPLLGVVQTEYGMKPQWAAVLLGLGSIVSGLAQPVFAWASDRLNTRIFGSLGILLGGIGITLIGFAPSAPMVFLMYAIGMLGIACSIPSPHRRLDGWQVTNADLQSVGFCFWHGRLFYWFPAGTLVGNRKRFAQASCDHADSRRLMAVVLQLFIGKINHKSVLTHTEAHSMRHYDWRSIWILYVSSVFRFVVNMAMVYLLVRWMEHYVAVNHAEWSAKKIADYSAPLAGRANATMILGQAIGGLAAGALILTGREKWPLVITPILSAPALASIAFLPPGIMGYVACFIAGIGFAAMTPVAISVGQRLMPYHTSLGSGIMLGGAWVIASVGPQLAEFLIQRFNLQTALVTTAVLLACSGLTAIGLKHESLQKRHSVLKDA